MGDIALGYLPGDVSFQMYHGLFTLYPGCGPVMHKTDIHIRNPNMMGTGVLV